jgi:hypothetical protein
VTFVSVTEDADGAGVAGDGEDAGDDDPDAGLSVLAGASVFPAAALMTPGEAATIVWADAAEVTAEGFTAGASAAEASDAALAFGASAAPDPAGAAVLSPAVGDLASLPTSALSLPGGLSVSEGFSLPEGLSLPEDLSLPLDGLSVPAEGHFGLVVRDEDSRAADAGGGDDPVVEVLAEDESDFDSGGGGVSLPLLAPLLAPSDLWPGSASGSSFRTTVSG